MHAAAEACAGPSNALTGRRVEERLVALARAGGPLRRVFAALAGRFSARRAWEPLGYARLGDYARERLGLSARMLQELARVEAGLATLPRLEAALVSGELPWSKVRLVARVASKANEAELIEHARGMSVRALERSLRCVDRGALAHTAGCTDEEGGSLEPSARLKLNVPQRVAFLWHRTRRYAAQQAGETTPPARVLEWVTAEVISGLDVPWAGASSLEERGTPRRRSARHWRRAANPRRAVIRTRTANPRRAAIRTRATNPRRAAIRTPTAIRSRARKA